jgi:transcriptional regulator with XRE-family HTH domain
LNQPDNERGGASVETARIDLDQLAEHVQWKMDQEDLSLREAAAAAHVSPATLSRILRKGKKRPQPDTGTLVHILNWVKVPIENIVDSPISAKKSRSKDETLEVIEVHLRADRNLSPEAAKVITQMVRAAYKQFTKQRRGSFE